MIKRFFILIFFIRALFLYGQDKIISKSFEGGLDIEIFFSPVEFNEIEPNVLDFFLNEDESKPGEFKLPYKIYFIAIPPNSKINLEVKEKYFHTIENVEITRNHKVDLVNDSLIVYSEIKNSDFTYDRKSYSSSDIELINYLWIRDYYCALIKVNTHKYSPLTRTLEILDSIKIKVNFDGNYQNQLNIASQSSFFDEALKQVIINYDQALQFRSPTIKLFNDTTGNWIDYSKEYIKLAIPEDNIYRITYDNLLSYGLNPNLLNPRTLKVYQRGKEIPIYVKGEEDGQFNENDYIEFYAERNYSYQDYRRIVNVREDYINYMNRYTDTSIVWLTYGGDYGQRIVLDSSEIIQTNDTVKNHFVKIHLEKDAYFWYYDAIVPRVQLPYWQENKVFTYSVIGSYGNRSFKFFAKDFVPNTPVKIITRLISNSANVTSNAHKHGLSLNSSSPTDTITYNFRQTVNFVGTYNSNQLLQGNNTVRVFGMQSAAAFHQSMIDWVDVEYFRQNIVYNDTLLITIPDSLSKDLRVIRIDGITTNFDEIVIYKIYPNQKRFNNFGLISGLPGTLVFIDTCAGGDKYYITKVSKISEPIFKYKKQFENLRLTSRGADYIIITNKTLSSSSNLYKNFIVNNYNIRAELVFDEDIYDEFSYGFLEAEAIKRFLIYAYQNWTQPKPSFLTLIGDANYDYKDIVSPAPTPRKKNLVTSFGNPVSDVWYVMWDSVNTLIPQMFVGRIPARNDEEVLFYLNKHQTYISSQFNEFNKLFLFFSGGDATNPSQIEQIKQTNNYLINNLINKPPLFGKSTHFYKTVNPPSNFGPYSMEEVQQAIDEGGLFISYIGHSGTRTWDNSISEVEHIKNKYADRFPLISDFGCSTGKFAEPDVDAFGELFVCQSTNGQAIAYLGNSSWGYFSTSLRFPKYFYEILTTDSLKGIGRAHFLAKVRQLNETGIGDVNQVFTFCNLLLGDPIIGLKIPPKPNLSIDQTKVSLIDRTVNDQMDSATFLIKISNFGIVKDDSLQILVTDNFRDSIVYLQSYIIKFPKYIDTLIVRIPLNKRVGEHQLVVNIDPSNEIDEIYEDDNSVSFTYNVYSTSLLPLIPTNFYNGRVDSLIILNPLEKSLGQNESIVFQLSDEPNFSQPREIYKTFDTLFTIISLDNLIRNKRYYFRSKTDGSGDSFSNTYSFVNTLDTAQIFINEFYPERNDILLNNVIYDSSSLSFTLDKKLNELKVISAGGYDGSFGSIQLNGYEQLPNTYYWGLVAAEIDSVTLKPISIRYFNVPDPGVLDSLANYVNRLPENTLVAMTISADAVQNVLRGVGSRSRNAIKTLGSLYIDSIKYRESWCILGKKGAPIGSVPEAYKKLFQGVAQIEVTKLVTYDSGYVLFPVAENFKSLNKILLKTQRPENSSVEYVPIAQISNSDIDTLWTFLTNQDSIYFTSFETSHYNSLKLLAKLKANPYKESPQIFSISSYFEGLPELGINYQTISVDRDTIAQGERVNLTAKIFNIGFSKADTFKITLELIKPDNTSLTLLDTIVNSLDSYSSIVINYHYINKTYDGYGSFAFLVKVDPGNVVKEFYEHNNTYVKHFFVKKDTTTFISETSLEVKYNGKKIEDGEYVDPNALILILLNYPVWFSVEDTNSIQIFIDGNRIYHSELQISLDSNLRKLELVYNKKFDDGEHYIRIFTKDAYGRLPEIPIYYRYFKVSSKLEIQKVFNYPNPFSHSTFFTFRLTQIPDEVIIKIYTISGRLVKIIKVSGAELNVNFNKIFWDGRDEDGDLIGNGIYLYKIIVRKGDKTNSVIQKLAVIR